MSKSKTNYLDCKKCNKGKVAVEAKLNDDSVKVLVKKCTNCKYQYCLKEIFADNGIEMKFSEPISKTEKTQSNE